MNDPVPLFKQRLLEEEVVTTGQLEALDAEIEKELDEAVEFALASPWPDPTEITSYVYSSG